MFRSLFYGCLTILFFFAAGCAQLTETAKKILGTSTQALERARRHGEHKTYPCSLSQCFEAVLSLERNQQKSPEPATTATSSIPTLSGTPQVPIQQGKFFDVFLKDPHYRYIVVIGIVGNVDTTEVGIFFDGISPSSSKIEIASLSNTAKRKVAKAVFDELDKHFLPADQKSPPGEGLPINAF